MAANQAAEPTTPRMNLNPLTPFKYSQRVLLKTLLERGDGGVGFVGKRVVIGGWVKSSREEKVEPPASPPVAEDRASPAEQKDVSCVEILQTRIPLFRSIFKVLGGASYTVRPRLEGPAVSPKPPPSIAHLQVSDGSCVPSLLVYISVHSLYFVTRRNCSASSLRSSVFASQRKEGTQQITQLFFLHWLKKHFFLGNGHLLRNGFEVSSNWKLTSEFRPFLL